MNGLRDEYARMAKCLPRKRRPAPSSKCHTPVALASPRRVVVTGYPDVTRGADGHFCGTSGNRTILADALPQVLAQLGRPPTLLLKVQAAQSAEYLKIDGHEAKWASTHVLRLLNARLKAIADGYGWTYLGSHVNAARRHGYCSGRNRWVRTWTEAKHLQEATGGGLAQAPGVVHPNVDGQRAYTEAIAPVLRRMGIPVGR